MRQNPVRKGTQKLLLWNASACIRTLILSPCPNSFLSLLIKCFLLTYGLIKRKSLVSNLLKHVYLCLKQSASLRAFLKCYPTKNMLQMLNCHGTMSWWNFVELLHWTLCTPFVYLLFLYFPIQDIFLLWPTLSLQHFWKSSITYFSDLEINM